MKVYKLEITRTRVDVGYVMMEAESAEDAIRKYKNPGRDEDLIFDCDIDWDFDDGEYDVEVVEDEEEKEGDIHE